MVVEQNKMRIQRRPLRRVSQRLGRRIRTLKSPGSQVTKVSQRIGRRKEEEGKNRGMIRKVLKNMQIMLNRKNTT